ncbi:DoxX family protein [Priestia megaterium]|nr:DoxX family protein [Priestia megaterium]MCU7766400.1 DoxX family protein [Priestia megaterium]
MTMITSKRQLWIGRIMSGLVILFMLFDGITKLLRLSSVVEGTVGMGFSEHHVVLIGLLGLFSIILYALPQTSVLGAILLTGYLGGAIASHIRLDNPLFSHTLSPFYCAVLAWGGIYFTNEKVRNLLSFQRSKQTVEKNGLDRVNID